MGIFLFSSPYKDGYRNLAMDEYLVSSLGKDDLALYFYINDKAVIIGKNQNPWSECDTAKMEADGVQLVRRITGGGAVYHDGGNLNYSFISGVDRYDPKAQNGLIYQGLLRFGIVAQATGRNDLTVGGRKFSGAAYCSRGGVKQSHGTLLVSSDLDAMNGYLRPSPEKLKAKGVASVRSRVCNLSEFSKEITVSKLESALKDEFVKLYGPALEPEFTTEGLDPLIAKHESWLWRMGAAPAFDFRAQTRLSFGMVQLYLTVKGGVIESAKLFTDAMDDTLPDKVEPLLIGVKYSAAHISSALACFPELAAWASGEIE